MPQITLYLVRHGEADSNALGLLSSFPEIPEKTVRHLTEKGRAQIQEVAESLASEYIDAIISSPLTRTRETAEMIGDRLGLLVMYDIRLRETDFGLNNELSVKDFFAKYPDPSMRIQTDGSDGLESFSDMRIRVQSFLSDVKKEFPQGGTIVIVSHGDTLEQLRGVIEGNDLKTTANGWMPEKGSVTRIEWS